jgi:serine/threonine-protein kinase
VLCPFCRDHHPPEKPVCPTTRQILQGLPDEGEIIDGKYRITGALGAGGMAAVYRAEHVKIGRAVALKLLLPAFRGDPELVERVGREARAAGSIDHANVVEIVDLGSTEAFGPYIAMELLRGIDLATHAENNGNRLPEIEAVEVMRQVLAALAVAHERGVIHRDLKPENIFLVEEEDQVRVKVVDFGISKLGEQHGVRKLTRVGTVMGTPQFMPREQAIGSPTQDHRIDIYACGAVLYALLSGALPYDAENYNLLVNDMLNKPPTPLRARNADIDPDLEAIVMKAIAKSPEERFADARSMSRALTEWAEQHEVSLRTSTPSAERVESRRTRETVDVNAPTELPKIPTQPSTPPPTTASALDDEPQEHSRRGARWIVVPVLLGAVAAGAFALRELAPQTWNDVTSKIGLSDLAAPVGGRDAGVDLDDAGEESREGPARSSRGGRETNRSTRPERSGPRARPRP